MAEHLLQGLAQRVATFLDSGVLHGWDSARAHGNVCVRTQECMCVNPCNAKLQVTVHVSPAWPVPMRLLPSEGSYLGTWMALKCVSTHAGHARGHGCICGLRGRSRRRCECPAGQPKEEAGGRMGRLYMGEEGVRVNRKAYRRSPPNGLPSTRSRLLIPEAFPLDFTSLVCHCKRKRKRRRQTLETRTQIDRDTPVAHT